MIGITVNGKMSVTLFATKPIAEQAVNAFYNDPHWASETYAVDQHGNEIRLVEVEQVANATCFKRP